jgi:hypothetical protein
MLTDDQALRMIESVRHNTRNMDVVALCDWILARVVQRREVEAAIPATADAAPKTDRRAYMREYMKRRREAQKRRCSPRFP